MLYYWSGAEVPLGNSGFTARDLIIKSFEIDAEKIVAAGSIDTMDYVENCGGPHEWEAIGIGKPDGSVAWQIGPREAFFATREGKPVFTVSQLFNEAIVGFVAVKLAEYLHAHREMKEKKGNIEPILAHDPVYAGPREIYSGPCLCEALRSASSANPFPWRTVTHGGNFPEHCFACSCGKKWWCPDTDNGHWYLVVDDEAWECLLDGNGKPRKPLGYLHGGFHLVQTLRNQDLIPLY